MSEKPTLGHGYRFRPTWTLAVLSIAGLGVMFFLSAGTALGDAIRLYGTGIVSDGIPNDELIETGMLVRGFLALATLLVYVPLTIFFCVWTYRSAANARALGAGGFEITPGWAVGWHFIPIANLWMPFKAFSEFWRASRADLPERVPGLWQDTGAGLLLGSWWSAWVLGRALNAIGRPFAREGGTLEAFGSMLHLGGSILESLAALLCIAVVYRLTARQQQLFIQQTVEDKPGNGE